MSRQTQTRTAIVSIAVAAALASFLAAGQIVAGDKTHTDSQTDLVNPVPLTAASARAGKQVYTRLCISCHGMDGKGAPGIAEHLPAPPLDLTDKDWKYGGTDGEVFRIIRTGTSLGMESFEDRLNEQRTWHVVNYLRTLAPGSEIALDDSEAEEVLKNPIPYSVESIRKGRFLYDSHCALCHGSDGSGYTDYLEFLSVPPADFTTGEFKYGSDDGQIYKIIRDGSGSKDMVAFGDRLKDEDMWNLVNYVKRFSR